MASGPIAFASDGPVDDKPPTEYGGMARLIQDHPDVVLTGADKRGILVRGEGVTVPDPVTGLPKVDESVAAVDPVTGREVDPAWNLDGKAQRSAVDGLKSGDPKSGVL